MRTTQETPLSTPTQNTIDSLDAIAQTAWDQMDEDSLLTEQLLAAVDQQIFFEKVGVRAAAEMTWQQLREQVVDLVNLAGDIQRHGGFDESPLDPTGCDRLVAALEAEDTVHAAAA